MRKNNDNNNNNKKKKKNKMHVFRAILVVQQNLTPFAQTCINEISTKFHLEVLQVKVSPKIASIDAPIKLETQGGHQNRPHL